MTPNEPRMTPKEPRMTPKELASAIRDKVGSQEEAAEMCKINQTTFGRILSGSDPKFSTVEKMREVAKKLKIRGAKW